MDKFDDIKQDAEETSTENTNGAKKAYRKPEMIEQEPLERATNTVYYYYYYTF